MRSPEITVPLGTPIQAHGEELKALTLRKPTGKDIRLTGMPHRFNAEAEVVMDAAVISKYVVLLAGIPLSAVDSLEPDDWMAVMTGVMGFFQPAAAAAS